MILPILLLLSLGIAVIYSSNQTLALQQLFFSLLGIGFYFFLQNFDYRSIKSSLKIFYLIVFSLLVFTLILGIETRGSVRWIPLGPFNLQPSEFAKPLIILILAQFWSKNEASWKNIFKSFLIILPICFLIFRQPDLGTTLTLFFIWVCMLFFSQVAYLKILILSIISAVLVPVFWFFLQDYQKKRFFSFINPNQDPQGVGFHVIQSTIAVGSGQFFGRGLGRGTQSRLQFLPEFRTDFIFAFISEELGFIGAMMVFILYIILFIQIFRVIFRVGDRFGELAVIGVLGMLFFQIFINIGMNIGLLPITGITLPLLSYGGSSIITTLIALGFVASVKKFGLKRKEIETFSF